MRAIWRSTALGYKIQKYLVDVDRVFEKTLIPISFRGDIRVSSRPDTFTAQQDFQSLIGLESTQYLGLWLSLASTHTPSYYMQSHVSVLCAPSLVSYPLPDF